jgi:hypothetical protein
MAQPLLAGFKEGLQMAKTLQERLTSLKANPTRFRTADFEPLITDLIAERDRLKAQHARDAADSVTFALADADRDDAADRAARAARILQGLEAELSEVRALLEQRLNSEREAASDAERKAALAERDALAAKIPDAYAAAAGALIGLAQEIIASDTRLRVCGLPNEISAEALARGCSGLFIDRGMHVTRLTKIRLPHLTDGMERLWPPKEESFGLAFTMVSGLPAPRNPA